MWTYTAYCSHECAAPLTIHYKIINSRRKMNANNIYSNNIYLISHPFINVKVGNIYYTQTYSAGSIPAGVSGFFIDIKSFRSHYGPGVNTAFNRNEYQEHFLGGKSSRFVRLTTLPPSCAVVMKSGTLTSWNPLCHSRPLMGLLCLHSYLFLKIF